MRKLLLIDNLIHTRSLKGKLTIVLIISSLIPLVLIGLISYYTIAYEMRTRVEGAIQSNLEQVKINLENSLNNLDYVSRQLAFSGTIAEKFLAYMEGDVIYAKYLLNAEIRESISLISNTNPNIGVILYFSAKNDEVIFSNNTFIGDFDTKKLHLLADGKVSSYYGPSPTANNSVNKDVFSIVRRMDNYYLDDCFVYVETDVKAVERILSPIQYSIKTNHILMDNTGSIVYNSGNPDFAIGEKIDVDRTRKGIQQYKDYYFINEISAQGWNIFAVISKNDFNRSFNQWLLRFMLISTMSLIISLLFALLIWRTIYRPMKAIKNEIELMSQNNYSSGLKLTNVAEFDELLNQFYHMKNKVQELLNEIENKERTKSRLEVEKLMHQINPHFLHNTLNTIQWMARSNNQTEIARVIALLTKVLHYNMAREGMMATIGQEIDALRSYVELQRIRYDQNFNACLDIEEAVLDAELPRFLLQPLVENAIYHGFGCKGGTIRVVAARSGDMVNITVADNGVGMSEQEIRKYLDSDFDRNQMTGLGLGISYVKKMIQVNYGTSGILNITSEPGNTVFIIQIPFRPARSGSRSRTSFTEEARQ